LQTLIRSQSQSQSSRTELSKQQYINRVRNLGENLTAMGGEVTEMDIGMSVLNGPTWKYENLLVALDAKSEDEQSLHFTKCHLLEEMRHQAELAPVIERIGEVVLVGANYPCQGRRGDSSKIKCYYCYKFGHISHACPVLKAREKRKEKGARDCG